MKNKRCLVALLAALPASISFLQTAPFGSGSAGRAQGTWGKACCQTGLHGVGGVQKASPSSARALQMMVKPPEENTFGGFLAKAIKSGVDTVANVVKGGVDLVGNAANAIVGAATKEETSTSETSRSQGKSPLQQWAEEVERERERAREAVAIREREAALRRRSSSSSEDDVSGLLDSLFEGQGLLGGLGRGLVGGIASSIGNTIADTRNDIADIIALTEQTLKGDTGATNLLGKNVQVGQPFSQSYSTSIINGVSTKNVILQMQVAGEKAEGVVLVKASIDSRGRIALQQLDLEGTGTRRRGVDVSAGRRSTSASSSSSSSSYVPPSERTPSSSSSSRASSSRASSSRRSSPSSSRRDSSEVIDVEYVDVNDK